MPRPKPQTPPSVSRGLRLPVELDRKVSKRMRSMKLSRNEYFRALAEADLGSSVLTTIKFTTE